MNLATCYAVGTILVSGLIIFGDIYDFGHGRILDKQGSVGTACGIAAWAWFFITVAVLPFLIINKRAIKGAVTFIVILFVSVLVWMVGLWPLDLPMTVPIWLYAFDMLAYSGAVVVSLTTLRKN